MEYWRANFCVPCTCQAGHILQFSSLDNVDRAPHRCAHARVGLLDRGPLAANSSCCHQWHSVSYQIVGFDPRQTRTA